MTITTFDKKNLNALRPEIQAALDTVAAAHGIKLQLGNISFLGPTFTAKVNGEASGADEHKAKEAVEMARIYGVDCSEPSTFKGREGAVLVEYNGRARDKPWIYALGDKKYITDQRGLTLMFPAAEGPVLTEANLIGAR